MARAVGDGQILHAAHVRGDLAGEHLRQHGFAEFGGQAADAPPLDLLGADERVAARVHHPDRRLPLGGAAADERHGWVEESSPRSCSRYTGDDLPLGDQVADLIAGENLR